MLDRGSCFKVNYKGEKVSLWCLQRKQGLVGLSDCCSVHLLCVCVCACVCVCVVGEVVFFLRLETDSSWGQFLIKSLCVQIHSLTARGKTKRTKQKSLKAEEAAACCSYEGPFASVVAGSWLWIRFISLQSRCPCGRGRTESLIGSGPPPVALMDRGGAQRVLGAWEMQAAGWCPHVPGRPLLLRCLVRPCSNLRQFQVWNL